MKPTSTTTTMMITTKATKIYSDDDDDDYNRNNYSINNVRVYVLVSNFSCRRQCIHAHIFAPHSSIYYTL